MSAVTLDSGGFWRRTGAMLLKEFLQLRRDRLTLATMVTIPLMQLLLFGYAINTAPRDLPTAVLLQENSDVGRSILKALENTRYFKVTRVVRNEAEFDQLMQSGAVLFAVEVPANFERALRRGDDACGSLSVGIWWPRAMLQRPRISGNITGKMTKFKRKHFWTRCSG